MVIDAPWTVALTGVTRWSAKLASINLGKVIACDRYSRCTVFVITK